MGATFLDIGSIRDVGQPKCIANKAQESPRSMVPDVYDLWFKKKRQEKTNKVDSSKSWFLNDDQ